MISIIYIIYIIIHMRTNSLWGYNLCFCKLQLVESTNSMFSLAPTRRKHWLLGFFLAPTRRKQQLPVFKHPLEPLRTTVLPSTSQPPWNINLCYWIYYSDMMFDDGLPNLSLFCSTSLLCLPYFLSAQIICNVRVMGPPCFRCATLILLHPWITTAKIQ